MSRAIYHEGESTEIHLWLRPTWIVSAKDGRVAISVAGVRIMRPKVADCVPGRLALPDVVIEAIHEASDANRKWIKWISDQRAAGWPSYDRAVYALVRGVPWEREDQQPDNPRRYMDSWWQSSRYLYSGLAPEDVRREICDIELDACDEALGIGATTAYRIRKSLMKGSQP